MDFFYPDPASVEGVLEGNENIREVMTLVELHGASTPELIMKYQQFRYEQQLALSPGPAELGMLTIRAHYCEDIKTLRIELLNARNLKATDANGNDSY